MHTLSRHAEFRITRNGGMRFVCVDVFGVRVQASVVRCRRSNTEPVLLRSLLTPARILAAAVAVMHIGASIIVGL